MGQCTPLQQLRVTMRRSVTVLLQPLLCCVASMRRSIFKARKRDRLVLSIKADGSSGEPRGRHREVGLP